MTEPRIVRHRLKQVPPKRRRPELAAWMAVLGRAFNVQPVTRCCGCANRKKLARRFTT